MTEMTEMNQLLKSHINVFDRLDKDIKSEIRTSGGGGIYSLRRTKVICFNFRTIFPSIWYRKSINYFI